MNACSASLQLFCNATISPAPTMGPFVWNWNRDHPGRNYLNQAVFPVYILHQSLIIILAWQLRPFHVPPVAEGLMLIVATLGISLLAYEAIRRVALLRPLFGLKF